MHVARVHEPHLLTCRHSVAIDVGRTGTYKHCHWKGYSKDRKPSATGGSSSNRELWNSSFRSHNSAAIISAMEPGCNQRKKPDEVQRTSVPVLIEEKSKDAATVAKQT